MNLKFGSFGAPGVSFVAEYLHSIALRATALDKGIEPSGMRGWIRDKAGMYLGSRAEPGRLKIGASTVVLRPIPELASAARPSARPEQDSELLPVPWTPS